MKRVMALLGATMLAASAHATVYKFNFTASIDSLSGFSEPLGTPTGDRLPDLALGDTLSGTLYYDDALAIPNDPTPDQYPGYTEASYLVEPDAMSFKIDRTGLVIPSMFTHVIVTDSHDNAVRPDSVAVLVDGSYYEGGIYERYYVALNLIGTTADILDGTALPGSSLSQLSLGNIELDYWAIREVDDQAGLTAKATITSLTMAPVPEPETYAMLLAGLGLLAWRQRKAA